MQNSFNRAALAMLMYAGMAAAQPTAEVLEVYTAKVKPDRREDFEASVKRMAAANRKHGGDRWIAIQTVYGADHGTYSMVSVRPSIGAAEAAMGAFMQAMSKQLGAQLGAFFKGFSATVITETAELRVRRNDLSLNLPESQAERLKLAGQSQYLRILRLRMLPGQVVEFIEIWKKMREALEAAGVKDPITVSQALTGPAGVFYITTYAKNMGDFDSQSINLPKAMGEAAYREIQQQVARITAESHTEIRRIIPEMSNPPDEVAAAAPGYWTPQPPAAKRPEKP